MLMLSAATGMQSSVFLWLRPFPSRLVGVGSTVTFLIITSSLRLPVDPAMPLFGSPRLSTYSKALPERGAIMSMQFGVENRRESPPTSMSVLFSA